VKWAAQVAASSRAGTSCPHPRCMMVTVPHSMLEGRTSGRQGKHVWASERQAVQESHCEDACAASKSQYTLEGHQLETEAATEWATPEQGSFKDHEVGTKLERRVEQ
jgi:hypothetical protein